MLIILGGLPGSGKTSVARAAARNLVAVHLRIDTIEQALLRSGEATAPVQIAGYVAGYAIAEDNLRLGCVVIADSVNPIAITRKAWLDVAKRSSVPALQVEVFCSDKTEHRRRVETRVADIEDHVQPSWDDVLARDYEPWTGDVLKLDTATLDVEQCAASIVAASRR